MNFICQALQVILFVVNIIVKTTSVVQGHLARE